MSMAQATSAAPFSVTGPNGPVQVVPFGLDVLEPKVGYYRLFALAQCNGEVGVSFMNFQAIPAFCGGVALSCFGAFAHYSLPLNVKAEIPAVAKEGRHAHATTAAYVARRSVWLGALMMARAWQRSLFTFWDRDDGHTQRNVSACLADFSGELTFQYSRELLYTSSFWDAKKCEWRQNKPWNAGTQTDVVYLPDFYEVAAAGENYNSGNQVFSGSFRMNYSGSAERHHSVGLFAPPLNPSKTLRQHCRLIDPDLLYI